MNAALPVVIMTAYGTVESAVEAMKAGASDYILKPFSLEEMTLVIRKGAGLPQSAGGKPLAARSAAPALPIPEIIAESQDAGGAGHGGTGGAH